jgi:branched-chain amino acid transport system substrate-binding protein
MRAHRRLVHFALTATLAFTLGGCAGDGTDGADPDATLRIGMLVSLTGAYKAIGADIKYGFQLYLDAHGGKLGGHPIELRTADEGDGAQTALPAATKLVKDDKVIAMTGVVSGGSVAAIAPVLTEAKIPLVGANGRPELKDVSRIWHTSYLSEEPGAAIAQHVKATVNGPVYAIGPDYQGGYDELRGFTEAFGKLGGKLANPGGKPAFTPFPATTNFVPALNAAKASGAKAIYAFYAGQAAIDFVRSYAQSSAAGLPLFGAGFLTEGSVLAEEGGAARNISTVLNYSPDLDNQANRAFVAAWKAAHPELPVTTYAMAAYDAAAVLDRAIAAAGRRLTPDAINVAISRLGQIDSPRGPWQFGQKSHAPVQKWYLRQVRLDGRTLSNVVVQDLATLGG